MLRNFKSAFTLIEILVSLAIVAVLSTVVVVTLNPAELMKQARDSNRISDLNTINTALGTYAADVVGATVGASSTVYVSLASNNSDCSDLGLPALTGGWVYSCVTADNLTKIDGTGWIPANFQRISFGNPLEKLPVDQKNTTSTGLYYTFVTTGSWWELTAILESEKYGPRMVVDGGASPNAFEQGTNLTLTPTEALDRRVPPDPEAPVAPSISSISPTSTTAGDPDFTLTVVGANFTSSSVINWGGSAKVTTFVSDAQLTAIIPASDVASAGSAIINVYDPTNGTSGSTSFAINDRPQFIAGSWTTDTTDTPTQSYGSSLVDVSGIIYFLAGNGTSFQKYDPSTKTWTTLSSGLTAGNGAALAKYNNDTIFAFAGGETTTFKKYIISTNTWVQVASTPAAITYGGSLTYPGSGDYLYGFAGLTRNYFWRYSVSNDSWGQSLVDQGVGNSIVEAEGEYYILGGGGAAFQKYDPSTKTWTTLSSGLTAGNGAALAKYNNDTIFAFAGGGTTTFKKYIISTNTWVQVASTSAAITYGGSLTYPGSGDYLYGFPGYNQNYFWRYSVSEDAWSVRSVTPASNLGGGAALVSFNSDTLYAFRGNNSTTFWQYTISTNTWVAKTSAPAVVKGGGSLTSDGSAIYALAGNVTPAFWKYSPEDDAWTVLSNTPTNIGYAGNNCYGGLAYSQTLNVIVAVSGVSNGISGSILEYDFLSSTWHSPTYLPASNLGGGAALVSFNSDTLYAFRGNNSTTFWQYTISTNTWVAKTSALAVVKGGGSLTSDGSAIYALAGNVTPAFWKYSPEDDAWTVLSNTPTNIGYAGNNCYGGIVYSSLFNSLFAISGTNTSLYKNISQ